MLEVWVQATRNQDYAQLRSICPPQYRAARGDAIEEHRTRWERWSAETSEALKDARDIEWVEVAEEDDRMMIMEYLLGDSGGVVELFKENGKWYLDCVW